MLLARPIESAQPQRVLPLPRRDSVETPKPENPAAARPTPFELAQTRAIAPQPQRTESYVVIGYGPIVLPQTAANLALPRLQSTPTATLQKLGDQTLAALLEESMGHPPSDSAMQAHAAYAQANTMPPRTNLFTLTL